MGIRPFQLRPRPSTLLVVILSLLAGCGPRYHWVKNVSEQERLRDHYECERDMRAGAASFGTGFDRQANANDFMGRCFQAKGYVLQEVRDTEPGSEWYRNNLRLCEQSCASNNLGPACYDRCRNNWAK